MSFCTVVVFVDKLLVSDTHLIYEHTTFASQNDVQNHHKNIWPRFGLKIRGGGGELGRAGPSPGFATEFLKALLFNYISHF